MDQQTIKIPNCFFVKNNSCGRIYGYLENCFIACPSKGYTNLIDLIKHILEENKIQPIIAMEQSYHNQDIRCSAICGPIIESKYCIVVSNSKGSTGNSNVAFEHGLMTSLYKPIIFLQEDSEIPTFDTFTLKSIRFKKKSIKKIEKELRAAIKEMKKEINRPNESEERALSKEIISNVDYNLKSIKETKNPEYQIMMAKQLYQYAFDTRVCALMNLQQFFKEMKFKDYSKEVLCELLRTYILILNQIVRKTIPDRYGLMVSSSYIIPQIESSWPLLSSHALLKDQLIEIMCTLFDDDAFKLLLDIIKKTPPEEIRSSPLKHRLIYSKNVEIHYYLTFTV